MSSQLLTLAGLEGSTGVFYIAPQNWRSDIRADVVYLQSPQPGTRIPRGTFVATWKFARAEEGTPIIDVPDLRGLAVAEASKRAEAAGLRAMHKPLPSTSAGAVVVDHFPAAGANAIAGSSIFFTWKSAGPAEPTP
jgi:beta-lactam-binding protein with PASTA domain